MTSVYFLPLNTSEWTDDNVKEIMKKSQREYQKRFGKRSQYAYTCIKCGKLTLYGDKCVMCSDRKYRCYRCDKDLTGQPRTMIDSDTCKCVDICESKLDKIHELEEELRQRTNSRDHYKSLYEEQKKLNQDLLTSYDWSNDKNKELQKENIKLKQELSVSTIKWIRDEMYEAKKENELLKQEIEKLKDDLEAYRKNHYKQREIINKIRDTIG